MKRTVFWMLGVERDTSDEVILEKVSTYVGTCTCESEKENGKADNS